MSEEDKQQLEYLRRWSQLSERERQREAILEWVAIVGTLAAFMALSLTLIALLPAG